MKGERNRLDVPRVVAYQKAGKIRRGAKPNRKKKKGGGGVNLNTTGYNRV